MPRADDVSISLLGPIAADRAGAPVDLGSPKQRAVLALLAVRIGRAVDRDVLLAGVWGDDVDTGRTRSLHTYVSNLRALLGDVVVREHRGYRLAASPDAVDAVEFERVVAAARQTMAADPAGTAAHLRDALAMWRGRPLADLDGIPGLERDVRRLEELRLEAVELRIDADLLLGRHEGVVTELAALADEHPLRERFRAQQMLALYRSGRQVDALRAYRATARLLGDELGVEPSPELQRLELAILGHDDELLAGPRQSMTQRMTVAVTEVELPHGAWDQRPQAVGEALAIHDRLVADSVERHGGHLVRRSSSGVVVTFATVAAAIDAIEDLQRSMTTADWSAVGALAVRVGIDTGEVTLTGPSITGSPLARAGRLCAIAVGGQVLLSATSAAELTASNRSGDQLRLLGEHELFGFPVPERVAQAVFDGLPADFPPLRADTWREAVVDEQRSLPGYELRARLGEGDLGSTWRAYQPSVGREVAVTVIRPDVSDHPEFGRRFEAEARTIARLAHPHIVPLIDFWRDATGAYLVMQLVDGGSLADGAANDVDSARRVLRQLAAALDHAHAHGVVLGRLTASNVLLDHAGNAYLSAVGIADRFLERDDDAQHGGQESSAAADIQALATLARSLLPADDAITAVLARATAASATDRHRTAAELVADLERALGNSPAPPPPPAATRNPYKALNAFDEIDAADFFGRSVLVDELVVAMSEHRFVMVVGPSGSGKSSVVRAGLLPAISSGAVAGSQCWHRTVILPGPDPMSALQRALDAHDEDEELLLVIDQFEEVYTLGDDEVRRHFVETLALACDAPRRLRVVATLRADFFDRPLGDHRLGPLLGRATVNVLPPDRDELLAMIVEPAHAVGLRWEPGLPHRIVEDVVAQPGGLPLLQYALTELVERRRGDLLNTGDYERIGGVAGSIAARAEAVHADLAPSVQDAARTILLRLLTVDDTGADEARRLVRRSELESLGIPRADLDTVLTALVDERLLLADRDPITHGPTIEVAHEALLRAWPRLRSWIEDEREALILGRRFRSALNDWESSGRDADYLLSGARLAAFDEWSAAATWTAPEREFHAESVGAEETRRRARRRRRRTTAGLLVVVSLVTAALAIVATLSARDARESAAAAVVERDRAEQQSRVARARELSTAAIAALDTDPALAKLLALASIETAAPTMETISVLRRAMAADVVTARHPWPATFDHMVAVALSPDGTLVAYGGPTREDPDVDRLEVVDVATWSVLWSRETRGHGADGLYFSPDSDTLVMGMTTWMDGDFPLGVDVRSASTGELVAAHPVRACGPTVAGVSATHALIQVWPKVDESCTWDGVVVEPPASLELIDLRTGETEVLAAEALDVRRPSLSGDGRYAAFGIDDGGQRSVVIDVVTEERVLDMDPSTLGADDGFGRALDRDGSLMLAGDLPLVVVDVASGEEVARFDEHGSPAHSAVFAGDGRSVWSVGSDGNLYQWDPTTGAVITAVPGAGGSGWIRSSADGSVVLVDDLNSRSMSVVVTGGRSDLWSIDTCGEGTILDDTLAVASGVALVNADCGESDLVTSVIDVVDRTTVTTLPGSASHHAALSPDGRYVARQEAAGGETPIRVRDVRSGEVVSELADSADRGARIITWSRDGRLLAAGARPGTVTVWDPSSGSRLGSIEACRQTVSDLVFTPDGSELVVGCFEEPLAVVSTATYTEAARPEVDVGHFPTFPGYAADDSSLIVVNAGTGSASMHWVDPDTFDLVDTIADVHAGATTGWATSPSTRLVATASSDGFVKVWDVAARRQVDEIFVGRSGARGVAFLDDETVLIATDARLVASTLDVDELVATARGTITRGFTRAECDRYGFGEACPTPEALAAGST
jgi:DNA-binding SARP family transcriptional activator/WD40 repeat protein/tRNA A-37 threonylcarbamoyl transferase component Bud32/energy-coupling factor transporter ATP-binding protein EcfA2